MNTAFLLLAQYQGKAVVPVESVCADYFSHLTPSQFLRKAVSGDIDLPVIRIEGSQKSAKGVHVSDLALYLDKQRDIARMENDKLHGRAVRKEG